MVKLKDVKGLMIESNYEIANRFLTQQGERAVTLNKENLLKIIISKTGKNWENKKHLDGAIDLCHEIISNLPNLIEAVEEK